MVKNSDRSWWFLLFAWILTFAWVALAVWYFRDFHDVLAKGKELRLGEAGDYLTGWATPLAFGWFIVAVTLQRNEFVLMRKEYMASREAAQEQAKHLEQSNLVQFRQVFLAMIEDAKQADV